MRTYSIIRFKAVSLALCIFFAAVTDASSQSGRVQPSPTPVPDDTVRVSTDEIKLNVLAFNEKGGFYSGVTDKDLVIRENDVLHQPSSVRRIPANVLIVMDTGGELRAVKSLDRTRRVASAVVRALNPDDAVAIINYSDEARLVNEWTTDKGKSLEAIAKKTNFGRRSAFVNALKLATDLMLSPALENRQLVLITDGTDSLGGSSSKFDAMQRLLSTNITVHVLSYSLMESRDIEPRTKGLSKTPPPKAMPPEVAAQLPNGARDAAQAVKIGPTINLDRTLIRQMKARQLDLETSQGELEKLAENTNGEFILPLSTDEMLEKAPLVAKMIDASYVVTYMPKIPVVETRGIAERKIEVTSRRPGLIVHSRRKLLVAAKK